MSVYRDLRLPDDGRSIRLLTIEPNTDNSSTVSCNLRVAAVQPGLQFEALSYCWGDPKAQEVIFVNGTQLAVTKNLSTALLALRDSETPRTFWVDALCINQHELAEKAFQVPLMGAIYGSASKTVIWLGESDEKSRKAF
ncbi:heterokaryon incompatibility protein-domain-containing protein, partial [Lophiotrema nucula]